MLGFSRGPSTWDNVCGCQISDPELKGLFHVFSPLSSCLHFASNAPTSPPNVYKDREKRHAGNTMSSEKGAATVSRLK